MNSYWIRVKALKIFAHPTNSKEKKEYFSECITPILKKLPLGIDLDKLELGFDYAENNGVLNNTSLFWESLEKGSVIPEVDWDITTTVNPLCL